MPLTCYEVLGSRRSVTDGSGITLETKWKAEGSNDETAVRQIINDTAPPIYYDAVQGNTAYRLSYEPDQVGFELWDVTVQYGQLDAGENPELMTFTFDTTGGTAHVTQSKGTRSYGSSPPDFKGAIGVTKDSVEGVEIVIPSLKFSETHPIPLGMVTTGWVNTIAGITGSVNNSLWRNYPAYSVLFLGARGGSSSGSSTVPVTFDFEVGVNASDLTVGGVGGVVKRAWEYLWAFYQDEEDTGAKKRLKKPKWIFVEEVYNSTGFGALGI